MPYLKCSDNVIVEITAEDLLRVRARFPEALTFETETELRQHFADQEREMLAAQRTRMIYG